MNTVKSVATTKSYGHIQSTSHINFTLREIHIMRDVKWRKYEMLIWNLQDSGSDLPSTLKLFTNMFH